MGARGRSGGSTQRLGSIRREAGARFRASRPRAARTQTPGAPVGCCMGERNASGAAPGRAPAPLGRTILGAALPPAPSHRLANGRCPPARWAHRHWQAPCCASWPAVRKLGGTAWPRVIAAWIGGVGACRDCGPRGAAGCFVLRVGKSGTLLRAVAAMQLSRSRSGRPPRHLPAFQLQRREAPSAPRSALNISGARPAPPEGERARAQDPPLSTQHRAAVSSSAAQQQQRTTCRKKDARLPPRPATFCRGRWPRRASSSARRRSCRRPPAWPSPSSSRASASPAAPTRCSSTAPRQRCGWPGTWPLGPPWSSRCGARGAARLPSCPAARAWAARRA